MTSLLRCREGLPANVFYSCSQHLVNDREMPMTRGACQWGSAGRPGHCQGACVNQLRDNVSSSV